MKSLVITSTRTAAGKTTVGLGIALNSKGKLGYFKPLGDHLVYSKKSLVDLDAMVYRDWLDLEKHTEECLGFDLEKLRAMKSQKKLTNALLELYEKISKGKDLVFIETGRNFSYGGLLGVDSATLAKKLDAGILLVAEGSPDLIVDKVLTVSRCLEYRSKLVGVVINKCLPDDLDKLEKSVTPALEKAGVEIIGFLPRLPSLSRIDVEHILGKLNAKLIAGSGGLEKQVEVVLVGALSADQALRMAAFHQKNKLIITGGDRVDLIYASLTENTSGIILTNNILPHPKVMSKAEELCIPVLSVPMDTYTTAKAVEHIHAEIRPDDADKKDLIKKMVSKELDVKRITG